MCGGGAVAPGGGPRGGVDLLSSEESRVSPAIVVAVNGCEFGIGIQEKCSMMKFPSARL